MYVDGVNKLIDVINYPKKLILTVFASILLIYKITMIQKIVLLVVLLAYTANAISNINHDGLKCNLCQIAVGRVEDKLTGNWTKTHVEDVLDNVCSRFPTKFTQECDSLVDTYTPLLIETIVEKHLLNLFAKKLNYAILLKMI